MSPFSFELVIPIRMPEREPHERGIIRPWRPHPKSMLIQRPGSFPFLSKIGIKRRHRSRAMSRHSTISSTNLGSNMTNSRNRSIFCKGGWTKPLKPPVNRRRRIRLSKSPKRLNVANHRANVEQKGVIQVPDRSYLSPPRCNTSILYPACVVMVSLEPRRLTTPIR